MIDVILPAYNNCSTINETIESIVRQSIFPHINVHIADDASQDATFDAIESWSKKYSNINIERNSKNLGVMGNYRHLIGRSSSKYVAPIEGDDIWISSERMEKLAKHLEETGRPACFSGYLIIDEKYAGSSRQCKAMSNPRYRRLSTFEMLDGNPPASFSNCIYRTDAVSAVLDETRTSTGYDWLVNVVLAAQNDGFDFFPEILSAYRISTSGAWSSLDFRKKTEIEIATLMSIRSYLPLTYEIDDMIEILKCKKK